jgi:serine/threonine-protein kinase HipA
VIRLARFYDLLSAAYYPNLSPEMAMKIGGEYLSSKISPKNFGRLAQVAGLAKPIVRERVPELNDFGFRDRRFRPLSHLSVP